MEQYEMDEEYLRSRARMEQKRVSMQQEDEYLARVRTLVLDQQKSSAAARRSAYDQIIGV